MTLIPNNPVEFIIGIILICIGYRYVKTGKDKFEYYQGLKKRLENDTMTYADTLEVKRITEAFQKKRSKKNNSDR